MRLFVSHSTALEKLEQEFQKAAAENRELDAEAVRRIVEQKVESDAAFKQGTERLYGLLTEAGGRFASRQRPNRTTDPNGATTQRPSANR